MYNILADCISAVLIFIFVTFFSYEQKGRHNISHYQSIYYIVKTIEVISVPCNFFFNLKKMFSYQKSTLKRLK